MDATEFSDLCGDADSDARMAAMLLHSGDIPAAKEYADEFAGKNTRILAHLATQERTLSS